MKCCCWICRFGPKFPRKQGFFGKFLRSPETCALLMVVFSLPASLYKENLTPVIDLGLFNSGFSPFLRIHVGITRRHSDYWTPTMFTQWINAWMDISPWDSSLWDTSPWDILPLGHFSLGTFSRLNSSSYEHFTDRTFRHPHISLCEHFAACFLFFS